MSRYDAPPPLGLDTENIFQAYVELRILPIKLRYALNNFFFLIFFFQKINIDRVDFRALPRVIQILKYWADTYFSDFLADEKAMLLQLQGFLGKIKADFPEKIGMISGLIQEKVRWDNLVPC